MLKLVETEFLKLRRKKFVWLMLLAALFMPMVALVYFNRARTVGITPMQFYKRAVFSYTPWIILPVVLGTLCAMLMYDENQYDVLKQLWIVPVCKLEYFFSKFAVVFCYALCFMLMAAVVSFVLGVGLGYILFDVESTLYLFRKCLEISVCTALAVLPLLAVAAAQKGYILPVCMTVVYTFLGFILLMVNLYIHPLSSAVAITMRDMPDVVLAEPVRVSLAFFCIGIWDAGAVWLANYALNRRM